MMNGATDSESKDSQNNSVESSIMDSQNSTTESSVSENSKEISVQSNAYNYFASSRLERDNMYSSMIETYENLLANETIAAEQKTSSTQEITRINNKKNSIMIAENLIRNLGFEDVVIFFNDNSVSVIVKADKLQEADVAQIQNVVCRELNVSAELVHISVR